MIGDYPREKGRNLALNVPRILCIVETSIDGLEALSPLEFGETQVVEEQVVMVLVQVEAGLKNHKNATCQAKKLKRNS